MQFAKLIHEQEVKEEYGLRGVRTFPWGGVVAPFESGYCIVKPKRETERHVNSPSDEEEFFIGCKGKAIVLLGDAKFIIQAGDQIYIPAGMPHSIYNDSPSDDFHFFSIWWNADSIFSCIKQKHEIEEVNNER